ncbi:hypothetical protein K7X08_012601 [Anisodus acutangulus]|uniref:Uncharacterized protein n=1 Tax=Anisodus acutangulus TaxID=402998 RepID=A0A9Q1LAI3_9SOLA|nr:hypothetical protein K7X08_012601 [Anisodus acutangulus]
MWFVSWFSGLWFKTRSGRCGSVGSGLYRGLAAVQVVQWSQWFRVQVSWSVVCGLQGPWFRVQWSVVQGSVVRGSGGLWFRFSVLVQWSGWFSGSGFRVRLRLWFVVSVVQVLWFRVCGLGGLWSRGFSGSGSVWSVVCGPGLGGSVVQVWGSGFRVRGQWSVGSVVWWSQVQVCGSSGSGSGGLWFGWSQVCGLVVQVQVCGSVVSVVSGSVVRGLVVCGSGLWFVVQGSVCGSGFRSGGLWVRGSGSVVRGLVVQGSGPVVSWFSGSGSGFSGSGLVVCGSGSGVQVQWFRVQGLWSQGSVFLVCVVRGLWWVQVLVRVAPVSGWSS